MQLRALKYFTPVSIYVLCWLSFAGSGWITWLPTFAAWVLIPLLEFVIAPDPQNLNDAEKELAKSNKLYDYLLYFIVVIQYISIFYFLQSFRNLQLEWWEITGRIFSMGLLCGTFGINVAHELGHRPKKYEQILAKILLGSSFYMHFFIEHNKGHHRYVATPHDPSSARLNEPVYLFYFRTIIMSYKSAWHIANNDQRKKGVALIHYTNEMIQAHIFQLIFLSTIYLYAGWLVTCYYLLSALIGILLLETVNYIEHYGLYRKETEKGIYERAMPWHSWNSDHVIGRIMLFELSRHSDHHYTASKKYQLLEHHVSAPELPTGYPGSMILALLPPLWFHIMNRKIKDIQRENQFTIAGAP